MDIKKSNFIIWIIGTSVACFSTILGMVYAETNEQVIISLLPIAYILAVTLSGALFKFVDSRKPGVTIINVLYFIKCVIYPCVSVTSGTTYNSTNNDTIYAVLLELGEVIIIYLVYFFYDRFNERHSEECLDYLTIQDHLDNGNFITVCFLLIVACIVVALPDSLSEYNFFTLDSIETIYERKSKADINGIVSLLIKVSRYVFTAYLLGFCYRKYKRTIKIRYIVLAVVIVGISMMIVRGVSRSDFVIPGLCGYFLLLRMFPKQKKAISASLLGCLTVVFVTFSATRYGKITSMVEFSQTLQAYFCCEKNMANAIAAKRIYGDAIGLNTLLSDLFGNWAGIGKFFRAEYNISEYFNYTFYGHTFSVDQIVPTIGQAYMQFGVLGIYIYTIIMVYVCLILDKKYRQSVNIDFSYLYLYGTVKCAVTLMGNLKIFSATVFNVLLPMLLLFILNSKIKLRRR